MSIVQINDQRKCNVEKDVEDGLLFILVLKDPSDKVQKD